MNRAQAKWRVWIWFVLWAGAALAVQLQARASAQQNTPQQTGAQKTDEKKTDEKKTDAQKAGTQQGAPEAQGDLLIVNDSDLPETFPRQPYQERLHARGGVPQMHWKIEKGALPPGIKLEDDGFLHGAAERDGEFQFTVSVTDGGKPQLAVQKIFVIRVRSALTLKWLVPAHVTGSRIDGSAEVSNTTGDDMDLTFVVMAVAENGRATAIGYQHFLLAHGTTAKALPFGETLPHGGYVVHVDAVGEVAPRNLIYRERMETPALQVVVGP